jgi:hypothetical protein
MGYVMKRPLSDGRKRIVKRAKRIERELIAEFGREPAPHQLLLIRAAAEMSSIAEEARSTHLAGGSVSLEDVVRTQGAMARSIKALQLPSDDKMSGKNRRPIQLVITEDESKDSVVALAALQPTSRIRSSIPSGLRGRCAITDQHGAVAPLCLWQVVMRQR